jgi:chorismate--pyruvate lyase
LNSSYNFPVGIPSSWLTPHLLAIPNLHLKNWLLDTGSLTERLVAQCTEFQLSVIGQKQTSITSNEFEQVCDAGQTLNEKDWQVREVLLWGDGQPWVFARSIIPMALWQRDFSDLNNQPLGQRIFNDQRFKRMPFEITKLESSALFLSQLQLVNKMDLWGRRSTFCFEDLKMMVCEVFLPGSPAYKKLDSHIA